MTKYLRIATDIVVDGKDFHAVALIRGATQADCKAFEEWLRKVIDLGRQEGALPPRVVPIDPDMSMGGADCRD
jgi:hypothetical protein